MDDLGWDFAQNCGKVLYVTRCVCTCTHYRMECYQPEIIKFVAEIVMIKL